MNEQLSKGIDEQIAGHRVLTNVAPPERSRMAARIVQLQDKNAAGLEALQQTPGNTKIGSYDGLPPGERIELGVLQDIFHASRP